MRITTLLPLFIVSSLALTGCLPEEEKTPEELEAIARAFAVNLTSSIEPIVDVEQSIEDFALQLETDLEALDEAEMEAMGSGIETWLEAISDYLEPAITQNENDETVSIDWSKLENASDSNSGISFTISGNSLTVADTVGSNEDDSANSNVASMVLTLPSATLTDNTAVLSVTSLSIVDNHGNSISATTASISLTFATDVTTLQAALDSDEATAFAMNLSDGEIVLGDAITLAGAGSLSFTYSETETRENLDFEYDMTGSIATSDGAVLEASADGSFYSNNEDNSEDFGMALEITVNFTEAAASSALVSASFSVDFDYAGDYNQANDDNDAEITLSSVVDLTIGSQHWGMGMNMGMDSVDETGTFSITDTVNTAQAVKLQMNANGDTDYDANQITIGTITVDGESFADIILDNKNEQVIADFPNLADVVLLSSEDFD